MNRIKQLRDEFKISQTELGKKLNKTQQQISLYENGTINMEFINQRMVKLPHTGSAKVLFMSVMGIFLMAKKLKEKE